MDIILRTLVPWRPVRYRAENKRKNGIKKSLSEGVLGAERNTDRVYMYLRAMKIRTRNESESMLLRNDRYWVSLLSCENKSQGIIL
jgi:hypothetical protein